MRRVLVVGCGGSGKTQLAKRLAARCDLPLTHLDAEFYDAEWNALPQEEFAARQRTVVSAERWLIDGNYASTLSIRLAAADTLVFLDLPAATCLLGVLQRRWRYGRGQHPSAGVYSRITWGFVRYIIGYRSRMRPKVLRLLREHGDGVQLVRLTSRRQVDRFVASIRPARRLP